MALVFDLADDYRGPLILSIPFVKPVLAQAILDHLFGNEPGVHIVPPSGQIDGGIGRDAGYLRGASGDNNQRCKHTRSQKFSAFSYHYFLLVGCNTFNNFVFNSGLFS
jgi:hypothetical protein